MIGRHFGKWTVIAKGRSNCRHLWWLCRCACGNEVEVPGGRLRGGKSSQCEACGRAAAAVTRTKNAFDSGVVRVIAGYRNKAISRGYAWELTKSYVTILVSAPCHYCGKFPSNVSTGPSNTFTYNGLDRKDNSKGYTPENTVACCAICNRWKSDMDAEQFVAHAKQIASH